MSYNITLTDGTSLTVISDGQIDQIHTDLTLIGKNTTSYGVFFNDNFVRLLENFANTSQPNHPLIGQLWFDTAESRLKVYNGTSFTTTNGTIVSPTSPVSISKGDIWIDSTNGQLWFNDGLSNKLAGPSYSTMQGESGLFTKTRLDVNGAEHIIVELKVGSTTLGIFSKDTFIPADSIPGFSTTAKFLGYQVGTVLTVTSITSGQLGVGQTIFGNIIFANTQITEQLTGDTGNVGTYAVSNSNIVGSVQSPVALSSTNDIIKVGFNTSAYPGIVFNTVVSKAQQLLAADGSLKTAESFLSSQENSSTTGTLVIQNDNPLVLGGYSDFELDINRSTNTIIMQSTVINQNFQINLKSGGATATPIYVNAQDKKVGIFTTTPTAMLDVAGSVKIQGDLTVQGNVTTVSSTSVSVADKNIVLGNTATPTDTTASGGGITLAGLTSKIIAWDSVTNNGSTNTGYWNFTDNINVGSSSLGYYINGQNVLSLTSLGSTITSAPGLTSVGILTSVQAGNLSIVGSTISYTSIQTSGDVKLQPKGTGSVDVSSTKIINLATPTNGTDATNKSYVDSSIKLAPLGISLNTTGQTDTTIGTLLLATIFPVAEHPNGTKCRVQCSDLTIKLYEVAGGVWSWQQNIPF